MFSVGVTSPNLWHDKRCRAGLIVLPPNSATHYLYDFDSLDLPFLTYSLLRCTEGETFSTHCCFPLMPETALAMPGSGDSIWVSYVGHRAPAPWTSPSATQRSLEGSCNWEQIWGSDAWISQMASEPFYQMPAATLTLQWGNQRFMNQASTSQKCFWAPR